MSINHIDYIDDETCHLILSTMDVVELKLEDTAISIYANDKRVGQIAFRCVEEPFLGHEYRTVCHLTYAFIDDVRYKRHGIGTEAVRFFLTSTGHELRFQENDGMQKEDGSHLIGDGPAFVASLRAKQARGEL